MFDLSSIASTATDFKPQKVLAYGVQGIGKTTWGCTFDTPILLRIEDGAAALDVPTFPKLVETYAELCEAINALHGDHGFKALVLHR